MTDQKKLDVVTPLDRIDLMPDPAMRPLDAVVISRGTVSADRTVEIRYDHTRPNKNMPIPQRIAAVK